MKDKDTLLLEETYENITSNTDPVKIIDATGKEVIITGTYDKDNDTFNIMFGNNYSLSRIKIQDIKNLYDLMFDLQSERRYYTAYTK